MQYDVYDEVKQERERQDAKWGQQNHAPELWMLILGEEFGEAQKAALEAHFTEGLSRGAQNLDDYRTELIQVAAVAVAAVQSLDRKRHPPVTPSVLPQPLFGSQA